MENVSNKDWQVRSKEKNAYTVYLVFFYLCLTSEWFSLNFLPFFKYFDEIMALLAIPLWFLSLFEYKKKLVLREIGYGTPIAVFLLFGVAGSLYYNYQPFFQVAVPQLLLWTKFWLAITTGRYLFRNLNIKRYAKRMFFHVKFVTWIFTVLVIIDNIFEVFKPIAVRYGFRSTHLFYSQVTIFAATCVFLISILMSVKEYVKGDSLYFAWLCALMLSTLRSKAFAAVITFIFIYWILSGKKGRITVVHLLFIAPIVLAVAWNQVSFYFFELSHDDTARYQLYVNSLKVASDHFPFGAGFGTYATYYSSVMYSPIYILYNMNKVWGLTEKSARFSNDTFWPAVLGETGWVGLIFYILAVIILFINIQKLRNVNKGYYMAGLFTIIYELIASTAESAFLHSVAIPLAVWLGAMFYQHDRKKLEEYEKKEKEKLKAEQIAEQKALE